MILFIALLIPIMRSAIWDRWDVPVWADLIGLVVCILALVWFGRHSRKVEQDRPADGE